MNVLSVDGVSKAWDDSSGLRTVSLCVGPGELVVVRGRSGTGKSTLLAIVMGWCVADAGSVVLFDGASPASADWSQVSIVPQVLGLVPELSIRENIAGARRSSPAELDAVIAELDLAEVAHRPPGATSMGQQQRAAVARALVSRSPLVLADEPTSHQDAGHVDTVVRAIAAAAHRGSGILVATHDRSVIDAATRVVELDG